MLSSDYLEARADENSYILSEWMCNDAAPKATILALSRLIDAQLALAAELELRERLLPEDYLGT